VRVRGVFSDAQEEPMECRQPALVDISQDNFREELPVFLAGSLSQQPPKLFWR